MKVRNRLLVSAMLSVGLVSPQAFAADTECSIVYGPLQTDVVPITANNGPNIGKTTPVPYTTIAVASNFYQPAIDLVRLFLYPNSGYRNKGIGVCHNATGHLVGEITNGGDVPSNPNEWLSQAIDYKYGLFLAANTAAPLGLAAQYKSGDVYLYAEGIPALLANPTGNLTDAEQLVTTEGTIPANAPSGLIGGDPYELIGPVIMDTDNLSHVGIGNRVNAPYGTAAAAIIDAMEQFSTPTAKPGNPPDVLACTENTATPSLCEYDNIDVTFVESVANDSGLDAGFVSWAQIKSAGNTYGALQYITFPSYAIPQAGVQLVTGANGSVDPVATALWGFMDVADPDTTGAFYGATDQTWNEWLEDHGYGDLDAPNPPLVTTP
ncbi:MAG: hypothetical protein LBP86_09715 [Azoarcus sp.]|jgi:hypothetical protein|nr:hypothetical protein [Azoarcus sp.]